MGRNKDFFMFSPNPVVPFRAAVFCAPGGDVPCPSVPVSLLIAHVYRRLI